MERLTGLPRQRWPLLRLLRSQLAWLVHLLPSVLPPFCLHLPLRPCLLPRRMFCLLCFMHGQSKLLCALLVLVLRRWQPVLQPHCCTLLPPSSFRLAVRCRPLWLLLPRQWRRRLRRCGLHWRRR